MSHTGLDLNNLRLEIYMIADGPNQSAVLNDYYYIGCYDN